MTASDVRSMRLGPRRMRLKCLISVAIGDYVYGLDARSFQVLRKSFHHTLRALAGLLAAAALFVSPAIAADQSEGGISTGNPVDFDTAPKFEGSAPTYLKGVLGLDKFSSTQDRITITGRILVDNDKRHGVLEVHTTLAEGWHIYSLTQKAPPQKTTFEFRPSAGVQVVGPVQADRAPEVRRVEYFEVPLEEYSKSVVWRAPIEIAEGVDPESVRISGILGGQVCHDNLGCVPLDLEMGSFDAGFAEYVDLGSNSVAMAAAPSAPAGAPVVWRELLTKMASGFLGGLLLNLMPCVLPVIGLKVMSFAQQAGESRRRVVLLNAYFVVGILAVFMVLAALAAFSGWQWGDQFQRPSYGIALALVVFVFALSFLGVWEVPIPGFVSSGSAGKAAAQEGPTGAIAKGILTTLLATPCGAPFIVPTLAWAVTQHTVIIFATFASMGLGMGAPYVLFGMFPGLMRALPKPGAWMETFKQSMGFILLGTVVWILFFVNKMNQGYVLPTVGAMFAAWLACWWIGRIPVTASTIQKVWSYAGSIALAVILGIGSFEILGPAVSPWPSYSPAALASLRAAGQPVFVDFTAAWCLSCKMNERWALHNEKTANYLQANGITVLVADKTKPSPEIDQLLKELGNTGGVIPFYAIYPPDGSDPVVFSDIPLTPGRLLEYFEQALNGRADEMVGTRRNAVAPGVVSMQ